MSKRKAVSKKIRFEVFKRDSFTCQYCGKAAPEVILHLDHIYPVSKGGTNELLNLVTACDGCNLGKSDNKLDDNSMVEKQRRQLAELGEKHSQLEMMIQWREAIKGVDQDKISAIEGAINDEMINRTINEYGLKKVKGWLKKFSVSLIFEAIEASSRQYLEVNGEGENPQESVSKFIEMIPRVAHSIYSEKSGGTDYRDANYARGIIRNRLSYINEALALSLLKRAQDTGYDMDSIKRYCSEVTRWDDFKRELEGLEDGQS